MKPTIEELGQQYQNIYQLTTIARLNALEYIRNVLTANNGVININQDNTTSPCSIMTSNETYVLESIKLRPNTTKVDNGDIAFSYRCLHLRVKDDDNMVIGQGMLNYDECHSICCLLYEMIENKLIKC